MYKRQELVSRDFLLKEKPDAIIDIVDATNIERNLYLSLQLMELGLPIIIALNMMDEVRENGTTIDVAAMERELGVPVVPISASKNDCLLYTSIRIPWSWRSSTTPSFPT